MATIQLNPLKNHLLLSLLRQQASGSVKSNCSRLEPLCPLSIEFIYKELNVFFFFFN